MSTSSSNTQNLIFSDDPYERFIKDETKSKNLISNDRSSKFSRKFKALKDGFATKKTYFIYGGLQGAAIGALAGFGIGIVTAFQTRRLLTIPLSMIGSALFFSGVMAFGSLIRSADFQHMSTTSQQHQQYRLAEYVQKANQLMKEN